MSKISLEVTPDQHKRLKAIAALSGKSLKDYMLEKTLPVEDDEKAAMPELLEYLKPSIQLRNGVKNKLSSIKTSWMPALKKLARNSDYGFA